MHVRRLLEVDAAQLAARRIRMPDLLAMERIAQGERPLGHRLLVPRLPPVQPTGPKLS